MNNPIHGGTVVINEGDSVKEFLKRKYPHGHPDFIKMTLDEIKLHSEKNYDYAAGGDPLGNFDRVAAICDLYPGLKPGDPVVIAIIYELKQLDQVLWSLARGYEGSIEGIIDRLKDISIYSKLEMILQGRKNAK